MKKEELQNVIDKLENACPNEKAYFGIFMYGGDPTESYIKANKEGLELFALEILKVAQDSEKLLKSDKDTSVFPEGFKEDWIDNESSTFIQYVELTNEIRANVEEPYSETWNDLAMKFGCIGGILIAIISFIVGFVTVLKWLFEK